MSSGAETLKYMPRTTQVFFFVTQQVKDSLLSTNVLPAFSVKITGGRTDTCRLSRRSSVGVRGPRAAPRRRAASPPAMTRSTSSKSPPRQRPRLAQQRPALALVGHDPAETRRRPRCRSAATLHGRLTVRICRTCTESETSARDPRTQQLRSSVAHRLARRDAPRFREIFPDERGAPPPLAHTEDFQLHASGVVFLTD